MEKVLDCDSLLPGLRYRVFIGSDILEGTFIGRVSDWRGRPYVIEMNGQLVFADAWTDKGNPSKRVVLGVNPEIFEWAEPLGPMH